MNAFQLAVSNKASSANERGESDSAFQKSANRISGESSDEVANAKLGQGAGAENSNGTARSFHELLETVNETPGQGDLGTGASTSAKSETLGGLSAAAGKQSARAEQFGFGEPENGTVESSSDPDSDELIQSRVTVGAPWQSIEVTHETSELMFLVETALQVPTPGLESFHAESALQANLVSSGSAIVVPRNPDATIKAKPNQSLLDPSSANVESLGTLDEAILPTDQTVEKNCWTHLIDWNSSSSEPGKSLSNSIESITPDPDAPIAPSHSGEMKSFSQIGVTDLAQGNTVDGVRGQKSTSIGGQVSTSALPTVSQQFADNFVRDVSLVNKQDSKSITMHLHPADLGKLTVVIDWDSDVVSASIVASEKSTSDTLNRDRHWLMNSLSESGFALSSFDVRHDESNFQDSMDDQENSNGFSSAAQSQTSDSEIENVTQQVRAMAEGNRSGINVLA